MLPPPVSIAAFQAAGDGCAQAVLIPPAYTRRVADELLPQLPKEIGGGPSSVLTKGIAWAAVGIDLSPRLAVHAVIKSDDAQAADALRGKWLDILRLCGQQAELRKVVPQFDKVAALLTPRIEGDRLLVALDDPAAFDQPGGLSVASGKLYIADTNNHLIRLIDLSVGNRVATLRISGL